MNHEDIHATVSTDRLLVTTVEIGLHIKVISMTPGSQISEVRAPKPCWVGPPILLVIAL